MSSNEDRILWVSRLRIRNSIVREFLAEFMGTFMLALMTDGVIAQVVVANKFKDPNAKDYFAINWGGGMVVSLGILIAGGASGSHINPAVTTSLAFVGKFPFWKIFHYMIAQYLACVVASSIVYLTYMDAFLAADALDNGQPHLTWKEAFGACPVGYLSVFGGFFAQAVGTAILLLIVCAVIDEKNLKIPPSLIPLYVGFTVLNIGVCFGFTCGILVNPAKDIAPWIFAWIAGWSGDIFMSAYGWPWIPLAANHIGGAVGATIYSLAIGNHWPIEKEPEDMEQSSRKNSIILTAL